MNLSTPTVARADAGEMGTRLGHETMHACMHAPRG